MSDERIARLERELRAERRIAVHAPINGIVTEIGVREGAQVNPVMALFNLVDLSSVWVVSEVPEAQASWIAAGRRVELKLAAYPGATFDGTVDFIYPGVTAETRTIRVRSQVANARLRLKPGMVADVTIFGGAGRETLLVPAEAVIRTGKETVVIVDRKSVV